MRVFMHDMDVDDVFIPLLFHLVLFVITSYLLYISKHRKTNFFFFFFFNIVIYFELSFFLITTFLFNTQCNKGQYGDDVQLTFCLRCFAGRYTDQRNSTACKYCPLGYYNLKPNSINCSLPENDAIVGEGGNSQVKINIGK